MTSVNLNFTFSLFYTPLHAFKREKVEKLGAEKLTLLLAKSSAKFGGGMDQKSAKVPERAKVFVRFADDDFKRPIDIVQPMA